MLAFTNTKYTKSEAVALAKHHQAQDAFIKGTYGENTPTGWRGCSVGCMAKGKHSLYPELFGIDTRIAHISDRLFENIQEYKGWTVKFFDSIKEGSDTTLAYYRFMHWMLLDAEHGVIKFNKHKSIVDVGELFLRASNKEIITQKQWRDVYAAADAAASASASAAYAYASAAAAYAASAADAADADAADASYAAVYAAAAVEYAAANHYEIMAKKLCYFLGGN